MLDSQQNLNQPPGPPGPAGPSQPPCQCVVLCAAEPEALARARQAVADQGWEATFEHEPFLAMAHLCLHERSEVSRAAWGLGTCSRPLLVVCQPQRWPEFELLAEAVAAHLPAVGVWVLAEGSLRELTPGVPRESATAAATEATSSSPAGVAALRHDAGMLAKQPPRPARSSGPPPLRLAQPMSALSESDDAGDQALSAAEMDDEQLAALADSTRVTPAELEMLFNPPPPPQPKERHA